MISIHNVGVSHRTAPIDLLEKLSLPGDRLPGALHQICDHPAVREAMLISTCNRLEVFVATARHSEATCHVVDSLAALAGIPAYPVWESVGIRREPEAVTHMFQVACGLDSMALGEEQIVAQLRSALQTAQGAGTVGPVLTTLAQSALQVSKRARTETGIGKAGISLVHVGLELAADMLEDLHGRTALLIGTGTIGSLAGRLLRERRIGRLHVASRTAENARRLAAELGGEVVTWDAWDTVLEHCDIVVCSTGAQGLVLSADRLRRARKNAAQRPLFALDLAMPRDVDPMCGDIDGVRLVGIETLGEHLTQRGAPDDVGRVEAIVTDEVAAFLSRRLETTMAPLIVALRSRAREVVDAELARLNNRLPSMGEQERSETVAAVNRIVGKLLHTPIVRAKQFSATPDGRLYLEVLSRIFDLDVSEASS